MRVIPMPNWVVLAEETGNRLGAARNALLQLAIDVRGGYSMLINRRPRALEAPSNVCFYHLTPFLPQSSGDYSGPQPTRCRSFKGQKPSRSSV